MAKAIRQLRRGVKMQNISIFQFTMYDIMTDTKRLSKRFGTIEAINKIGGQVILESVTEIKTSDLSSDLEGFTKIGFQTL